MIAKLSKREAQQRVDRIHAFRRQLEDFTQEGALELSGEQRARLDAHIDRTLDSLAAQFDVDINESQKRLSLGMRIVSTLGGLAFCGALFLFFYRYWGYFTTPVQLLILAAVPILALVLLQFVAQHDKTSYYTGLVAAVALASFILNLYVLGVLFNITPSPASFLAWGVLALILAYAHSLRLLLAAGLVLILFFCAAILTAWSGGYWLACVERPETFLLTGIGITALPFLLRHRKRIDFPSLYWLIGLSAVFLSLWLLGYAGRLSYLPLTVKATEVIYRITEFAATGLTIGLGIRANRLGIVNLGSAFFAVYLFNQFFSWWWDWMPKYLFFLIIGSIALLLLVVFQKLRTRTREATV